MISHRTLTIAAMSLIGVLLVGCGSSGNDSSSPTSATSSGAGTSNTVTIDNFAFTPDVLTVSVGDTVTWTNAQGVAHTVTADDEGFDSGNLAESADFSQTFATAGTFAYHCSIHPSMTGAVMVQG